jgi:hypothetical protein
MKTPSTQLNSQYSKILSILPNSAEFAATMRRFPRLYPRLKIEKTAVLLQAAARLAVFLTMSAAHAQQGIASRGDIVNLPAPLKARIVELANRPHTYLPLKVFAEAPSPSTLFAYYLLDTKGFEPNIFTTTIPGINDGVAPTATGANGDLPTIASIRLVVEPKPGLPTDPNDPGAFIDIFTDISGLFVINNESGWYEGWMIHDLEVPDTASPRPDGHARFGKMTTADAAAIKTLGSGHNVPGRLFTMDGEAVHFPSASDHFPDRQTNVVPLYLSMGAYNSLQQADAHSYWEFNQYTNWIFPLYELPFTGGIPGTFAAGKIGALQSIVPGDGPAGRPPNDPRLYGDNPHNPRDPDRLLNTDPSDPDRGMVNNEEHKEKRLRFIPSGLANEIMLDVFVRIASFEPGVTSFNRRLFDAYAAEVARVDGNADGVIDAIEGDLEEESDDHPNERLYIPATKYGRFAVTREIDDGLLAPRFAPSQRGWVLTGFLNRVTPAVDASVPQDADNR